MSQSPVMFFRNRILPSVMPSLVKAASKASCEMIGSFVGVPMSDHVPELMNAQSSEASLMDATALAVSCEPTATTLALPPNSSANSSVRRPITVPGYTISCIKRLGNPNLSKMTSSH